MVELVILCTALVDDPDQVAMVEGDDIITIEPGYRLMIWGRSLAANPIAKARSIVKVVYLKERKSNGRNYMRQE